MGNIVVVSECVVESFLTYKKVLNEREHTGIEQCSDPLLD
jgi:hypothetical protein